MEEESCLWPGTEDSISYLGLHQKLGSARIREMLEGFGGLGFVVGLNRSL